MPDERRRERGVLDTSVIIDFDNLDASVLPREVAVTAITMAELAAGPHATTNPDERARRQDRLQRAEAAFGLLVQAATSLVAYSFERMLRNAWAAEKAGTSRSANMEEALFRLDKSVHRN